MRHYRRRFCSAWIVGVSGCQGNWHSRSVCRQRVPVPGPLCYISRDVFSWPLSLPCRGAGEGHGCSSPMAACEPSSTARRGLCRLCRAAVSISSDTCCPRLCPSLVSWGPWRLQLVHRESPECAHLTSGAPVGTGRGTGCWVSFPVERSKPAECGTAPSFSPHSFLAQSDLVTHLTASWSCFLQALSIPKAC